MTQWTSLSFSVLYRNVGLKVAACTDGGQVNWNSFWEGPRLYIHQEPGHESKTMTTVTSMCIRGGFLKQGS